jgi:hypothetical protein
MIFPLGYFLGLLKLKWPKTKLFKLKLISKFFSSFSLYSFCFFSCISINGICIPLFFIPEARESSLILTSPCTLSKIPIESPFQFCNLPFIITPLSPVQVTILCHLKSLVIMFLGFIFNCSQSTLYITTGSELSEI